MKRETTYRTGTRGRSVVMVTYPDAHILDVVGPLEVLTGAKYFLPEGPAPYDVRLVAAQAGPVPTTSGLSLTADLGFAEAINDTAPIDTLIVSGGHGTMAALEDRALLDFVRKAAARARRVVSICTGAMILAETRPARRSPREHALVVVPNPRKPLSEGAGRARRHLRA